MQIFVFFGKDGEPLFATDERNRILGVDAPYVELTLCADSYPEPDEQQENEDFAGDEETRYEIDNDEIPF